MVSAAWELEHDLAWGVEGARQQQHRARTGWGQRRLGAAPAGSGRQGASGSARRMGRSRRGTTGAEDAAAGRLVEWLDRGAGASRAAMHRRGWSCGSSTGSSGARGQEEAPVEEAPGGKEGRLERHRGGVLGSRQAAVAQS